MFNKIIKCFFSYVQAISAYLKMERMSHFKMKKETNYSLVLLDIFNPYNNYTHHK